MVPPLRFQVVYGPLSGLKNQSPAASQAPGRMARCSKAIPQQGYSVCRSPAILKGSWQTGPECCLSSEVRIHSHQTANLR